MYYVKENKKKKKGSKRATGGNGRSLCMRCTSARMSADCWCRRDIAHMRVVYDEYLEPEQRGGGERERARERASERAREKLKKE